MRRRLIFLIIFLGVVSFCLYVFAESLKTDGTLTKAFNLLKSRNDDLALAQFKEIIGSDPDNVSALCGKAEVLRRRRKFKEAQTLIDQALSKCSNHPSCMNSLAYIKYYQGEYAAANQIIKKVLNQINLDIENKALAYVLLGTIHAAQAREGNFLSKLFHGTQIKGYFEKAKKLSPDLPEAHLGLGTFYLLAPNIAGGSLKKAREELECAVRLTPDFATANARLSQAYKKQGKEEKFQFYCQRARELDPDNEVLKEIDEQNE
jgi:tetratricopeptide (TPR) repeat protein